MFNLIRREFCLFEREKSSLPTRVKSRNCLSITFLALSVGLCTTGYTLVDKLFLQYLSPLSLLGIANIGFMLGITRSILPFERIRCSWQKYRTVLLIGAVLSPGSYLLFLYAMDQAPVSNIAPLREVGIVFGTIVGLTLLKERHFGRRLAASMFIVSGIWVIAAFCSG